MSGHSAVGASRTSAINRTGGAYRPVAPPPSRAIQARRFLAVAKVAVRSSADLLSGSIQRLGWLRARKGLIDAYFSSHEVRKVHLGCGPVLLDGWLNADLRPRTADHIFIDVTEELPFADGSVDYIFTEHLIGDLTYPQAGVMLAECHRVLRSGGRLRISTPNLARLAELYDPNRSPLHTHYVEWAVREFAAWADAPLEGLVINNLFQEHPFVYDPATLRHVLQRAGFTDITEQPFARSSDPHLDGLDSHGKVLGRPDVSSFESVTLEATRE
jgi:SAM-dependent methyltransferase